MISIALFKIFWRQVEKWKEKSEIIIVIKQGLTLKLLVLMGKDGSGSVVGEE